MRAKLNCKDNHKRKLKAGRYSRLCSANNCKQRGPLSNESACVVWEPHWRGVYNWANCQKPAKYSTRKIREIDWSYFRLQRFDKFGYFAQAMTAETFLLKLVKSLWWTYFRRVLAIWNHCGVLTRPHILVMLCVTVGTAAYSPRTGRSYQNINSSSTTNRAGLVRQYCLARFSLQTADRL